jgi:hypothetical protein
LDTDYNSGAAALYNMPNTANEINMLAHDSVIKVATHVAQYSTAFELIRQDTRKQQVCRCFASVLGTEKQLALGSAWGRAAFAYMAGSDT